MLFSPLSLWLLLQAGLDVGWRSEAVGWRKVEGGESGSQRACALVLEWSETTSAGSGEHLTPHSHTWSKRYEGTKSLLLRSQPGM